jgi:Transglutaminase-like superfamily
MTSTGRGWKRSLQLARLTAQAWTALLAFDVARVGGFARLHQRLRTCAVRPRSAGVVELVDVVWAVDEACVWYVRRVLCLQRSAVTTRLLRRCGIGAELVIGYRPLPFESHAWVEVNGQVVNDRPQYQRAFTVLERL